MTNNVSLNLCIMADYQVKTKSGYDFYEVSSAFQKSIRRCDETEAMFWATELHISNYQKYLWKRMLIMTSEDVGLANIGLPAQMAALKSNYDYLLSLKDKHTPEILPLIHALLLLVRSKKSRFVDLAFVVYWDNHQKTAGQRPIPDWALDCHTRRGKAMKRGNDHFYEVGAFLNQKAEIYREIEFEALAKAIDAKDDLKPSSKNYDDDGVTTPPTIQQQKMFE